jgi:hypothetical protein
LEIILAKVLLPALDAPEIITALILGLGRQKKKFIATTRLDAPPQNSHKIRLGDKMLILLMFYDLSIVAKGC